MSFNKISDVKILDLFSLSEVQLSNAIILEEKKKKCLCNKLKGECLGTCKCKEDK